MAEFTDFRSVRAVRAATMAVLLALSVTGCAGLSLPDPECPGPEAKEASLSSLLHIADITLESDNAVSAANL